MYFSKTKLDLITADQGRQSSRARTVSLSNEPARSTSKSQFVTGKTPVPSDTRYAGMLAIVPFPRPPAAQSLPDLLEPIASNLDMISPHLGTSNLIWRSRVRMSRAEHGATHPQSRPPPDLLHPHLLIVGEPSYARNSTLLRTRTGRVKSFGSSDTEPMRWPLNL